MFIQYICEGIMLKHLSINNFAIVKETTLSLHTGMSVITGETGAGKSIGIDALSLCLGARAESSMLRYGEKRIEVVAIFDLSDSPEAMKWLQFHQFDDIDLPLQCTIRRIVHQDGRSRAFVNQIPISLTNLKELTSNLVQINGQHSSYQLIKPEHQLSLLDAYCNNELLLKNHLAAYNQWSEAKREFKQFAQNKNAIEARRQLLHYQVEELNEFNLLEDEFEQLEQQHHILASSDQLSQLMQSLQQLLSENDTVNIESLLFKASKYSQELVSINSKYQSVENMLNDAFIQVQESITELNMFSSSIENDPELLLDIESRLSHAMQLSKKHNVLPRELFAHHQLLKRQLADLGNVHGNEQLLQDKISQYEKLLAQSATNLYQSRMQGAKRFATHVTKLLNELAMEHAKFTINLQHDLTQISPQGADEITFCLRSNLGQPSQPIAKIASGGELSRIALAINVVTADVHAVPTMIFDEIDVGISGATASVVGRLMRQLSEKIQILCITHLPQVAAYGHHHFSVEKATINDKTETKIQSLDSQHRITALARLLGGSETKELALANAKELLAHAS